MKKISLLLVPVLMWLVQGCGQEPQEGTTKSGFRYIQYVQHNGAKPQSGDVVSFHAYQFKGDSIVSSTRNRGNRPASIMMPPENVQMANPSPIIEVLWNMSEGDSVSVFFPLDALQRKPAGYENESEVRYDVVVVGIQKGEDYKKETQQQAQDQNDAIVQAKAREQKVAQLMDQYLTDYKEGRLDDRLTTTSSGLQVLIIEQGNGPKVALRKPVKVHYYGMLEADGKMFDNSFRRGQPLEFVPGTGMVIKGWEEGIPMLHQGGKAVLFIPANLGYGASGNPPTIPGNANLVFYVEVVEVGK